MVTVALNETQADVLRDVLVKEVEDERVEARRTEDFHLKSDIRGHARMLDDVLHALDGSVSLTDAEASALRDVVRAEVAGLRVEIRHTDSWTYKASLRERAEQLRQVLASLT